MFKSLVIASSLATGAFLVADTTPADAGGRGGGGGRMGGFSGGGFHGGGFHGGGFHGGGMRSGGFHSSGFHGGGFHGGGFSARSAMPMISHAPRMSSMGHGMGYSGAHAMGHIVSRGHGGDYA